MPRLYDRATGIQALQDLADANGSPKTLGEATAEWDAMSTRLKEFATRAREALQSNPARPPTSPPPFSPRPLPQATPVPGVPSPLPRPNRR